MTEKPEEDDHKEQPEPGKEIARPSSNDEAGQDSSNRLSDDVDTERLRAALPIMRPDVFKRITDAIVGQWATNLPRIIPPDVFKPITDAMFSQWATNLPRIIPPDVFKPITDAIFGQWTTTQRTIASIATRFVEQLREAAPPNWDVEDDWPRLSAITAVVEEGIPIAWIPRGEIVTALIEADGAEARQIILATREMDVIEDCDRYLDSMHDPVLDDLVDMTRKAVRAFQGEHTEAAQALAASVLDTLLHRLFRRKRFRYARVRAKLESAWPKAAIQDLRPALVLYAIPAALTEFSPHEGNPVPDRFNRHASAHAVGTIQYTRMNAVLAIVTTTSLLKEASASGWSEDRGEAGSSV